MFNARRLLGPLGLVQLVCRKVPTQLLLLLPSDFEADSTSWKNVFRTLIRNAGMEQRHCTLFVSSLDSQRASSAFLSSLRSLLSHGIDFTLFESDELQVRGSNLRINSSFKCALL